MTTTAAPSISISRDIPARAAGIFAILTHPTAHPDVDGSGMLQDSLDDVLLSKVGDVFALNMHHEDMGDYVMENHVIEFEPDRKIAWEPIRRFPDGSLSESAKYIWGWTLEPLDTGTTRVTEFFDCSESPDWLKSAVNGGEGWRDAITASLQNLEQLTAGS